MSQNENTKKIPVLNDLFIAMVQFEEMLKVLAM
jgi:hypothetical protein